VKPQHNGQAQNSNQSEPGQSDAELVSTALSGNREAFEELVLRYQPLVSSYISHLLDDASECEDVAQEVFMNSFRKLHTLREKDQFAKWLKSIAWRQCRAWVKKQQQKRKTLQNSMLNISQRPGHDEFGPYADDNESDPWLTELAKTLESMNPGKRNVLALFYIRGLPHKRISEFLDIPVGTVKRRLHEGRKDMASAASEILPEDMAERLRFVKALRELLAKYKPALNKI